MQVFTQILKYSTLKSRPIDITADVENKISESGIKEGICTIHIMHTTALLLLNENEKNLFNDFLNLAEKIVPENKEYYHSDGNAHAHLKNLIFSKTLTIPINSGKLGLGTWQSIILVDPDGPRVREVLLKILGI